MSLPRRNHIVTDTNSINYLLLLLYICGCLFAIWHHEPWRDEAQAWLIARDLPFDLILKQVAYEGTPALWHLLLHPFASNGVDYFVIAIIHLSISTLAVAIFLFKAPFNLITKILFIFSYYMFFEYAVIARNYSLSILFLFSIAALYPSRFSRPFGYALLVGCLANTNSHSFLIAGFLGLIYFLETLYSKQWFNKIRIAALLLMLAMGLIAFYQLLSPPDNQVSGLISMFYYRGPFQTTRDAFFPGVSMYLDYKIFIIFSGLILLTALMAVWKLNRYIFIFLVLSLAWLFFIFTFKWWGQYRHAGLIMILVLFSLWVIKSESEGPCNKWYQRALFGLQISFSASFIFAMQQYYLEYTNLFSGSKKMADYIIEEQLTDTDIAAYPSHSASALLPYLPDKQLWYVDVEKYGTYVIWNRTYWKNQNIEEQEILSRIENRGFTGRKHLLLLNRALSDAKGSGYQLLHKVDNHFFRNEDEKFYLYTSTAHITNIEP